MTAHSGVLAWRIPGTGEPGGLLSMGSLRVEHDWGDLAAAAAGVILDVVSKSRLYMKVDNLDLFETVEEVSKTYFKHRKKQGYSISLKIMIECRTEIGSEFPRKLLNENIVVCIHKHIHVICIIVNHIFWELTIETAWIFLEQCGNAI